MAEDQDDGRPRPRPTSLVTAMQKTRRRRGALSSTRAIPVAVIAPYNLGPFWPFGGRIFTVSIRRSEEHTSELQSLMRISYAVFCLKKKKYNNVIIYTQRTRTHTISN